MTLSKAVRWTCCGIWGIWTNIHDGGVTFHGFIAAGLGGVAIGYIFDLFQGKYDHA